MCIYRMYIPNIRDSCLELSHCYAIIITEYENACCRQYLSSLVKNKIVSYLQRIYMVHTPAWQLYLKSSILQKSFGYLLDEIELRERNKNWRDRRIRVSLVNDLNHA